METSIWDQILARIETKVNRHSFSTWFKPTAFIADGGRSITIRVPNPLFKDWLTKHYSVVLSEALAEVRRPETSLVFVAEPGAVLPAVTEEPVIPADDGNEAGGDGRTPAGLNPRYTFDTFIVGPSNQFAHAACRAVAEAPSRSYNPLFIYGGVGPRQNAPDARSRTVRAGTRSQLEAHLHLVGAVHERDDQCGSLRPHSRFS
jgi:chromosomal replication initiator protein